MFSEYQSDAEIKSLMPEILSQHQAAPLVQNASMIKNNSKDDEVTKDDDEDETGDSHPEVKSTGVDNSTEVKFPPRFKHPSKMYKMDMKPAGSSIRFRCAAEGRKIKHT